MNKIYDKLLVLFAIILLALGVFLFLRASAADPAQEFVDKRQFGDAEYVAKPMPASSVSDITWPAAGEQSTGWTYDVFTPPKIFLGPDGQFTAEGYKPPPPPPPFGVYLAEISQKEYRIQLEGYIESDPNDSSKTLLLFLDLESNNPIRTRKGQTDTTAQFSVVDFVVERKVDEFGNIEKFARATIKDLVSGETRVLTSGDTEFEDETTVVIKSSLDDNFEIALNDAPTEFSGPGGEYRLLEINLEAESVTIEKQAIDEFEAETKTLSTSSGPSIDETGAEPTETPDESDDNNFDFLF